MPEKLRHPDRAGASAFNELVEVTDAAKKESE